MGREELPLAFVEALGGGKVLGEAGLEVGAALGGPIWRGSGDDKGGAEGRRSGGGGKGPRRRMLGRRPGVGV